jgi:hypothetical protein
VDRNKARDMQQHKGISEQHASDRVARGREAARQQAREGKAQMRARDAWPPNAGGCRGWLWTRSTSSTDPRAR